MADDSKRGDFRVIIAGGSVAGLVLAHSLHRAGIDYLVLEARDRIDPQVGASIGIFSNGGRILDQLGVYKSIEQYTEPPIWHEMLTGDGALIQKVDSLQLIEARTGYPVAFLERQRVLKTLYDHFPDQSKILTSKRVLSVDRLADGVQVHCQDGSKFTGDIIAGADGVHSRIRREMWRHAERDNALKYLKRDQNAMFAEYRCLFGISSAVPGLEEKSQYRTFNKDWSFLVVVGKDNRCFWFVFEKLDGTYRPPNMPCYTESDQTEFVKPFMKRYVAQTVTFDAVWQRRTASTLTVLEEAQYNHWTYDRFVCLGDAIHKMTPNIGQGGNWAIESAAALTNRLYAMIKTTSRPTIGHIRATLSDYEQSRQARTREVCETAGFATRLEAFASFRHRFMSLYVVPHAGDMLVDVHCQAVAQAPKLDFLPLPEKSLREGTIFQTAQLGDQRDNPVWRVLRALPLVGLCFAARHALGSGTFFPRIHQMNATERLSMVAFIGDLAPLQIIATIESVRRGNNFTVAALWALFGLVGQWKGTGYAVPVYFFLHYIQSSLDRYAAPDNRLVPTHYARTLLAAVGAGYLAPTVGVLFSNAYHGMNSLWQLLPLSTAILHRVFASAVFDTTATDRIKSPRADMVHLRPAYVVGGILGGVTYLYLWVMSPQYIGNLLSDVMQLRREPFAPVKADLGQLIRYNHLITLSSGLLWELLHFRDLKSTGRLKASWTKVIGVLAGTAVLFGPGAAMALGWAWREEVLARKIQLNEMKGIRH
ncbi:hypothetical protein DL765_007883 [Monosporascus sp. GIB2]|nr:hypothetical protein DL765_007883 [Monosporascus sp. GIB2]